jgi:hypothetical protein
MGLLKVLIGKEFKGVWVAGWGTPSFSQVNGRSAHVAIQVNVGEAGDGLNDTAKVGKAGNCSCRNHHSYSGAVRPPVPSRGVARWVAQTQKCR